MTRDDFIYGTIKEIEQFLGGNLRISREETKNSSELSFHSSEVLFHGSVENFHLLAGDFRFPR